MADRDAYLADIGASLHVGRRDRQDVLDELRGHIEDSVRGLEANGLGPALALRVALDRLGPASDLARDLNRARRGRRLSGDVLGRLRVAGASLALVFALVGTILATLGATAAATPIHIDLLPTTGTVDSVMAGYISDGIARAKADGAAAVVIELNTPGGSLDSTQKIVSSLLEAPLPTIVWVSPAGGRRAASAGTFITLASHIALMAPGTNIGAASPVDSSGGDIGGTLGEKVKNDAIANIRSIAETRGRNVDWAVSTVASAKSSPASEAVAVGAVDGIASTIDEVIAFANGKTVKVQNVPTTLNLTDASVNELGMNIGQEFLHLLSDPNIAFILFTIGFYGLLFELMHPNFVTGILGGLALILAFVGSGSLPLNVAGVLLLGLSVVLLFLEASVPSHGLLAIGALICFVLGAATFYTQPGPGLPDVQVSPPVILVTGSLGVLFAFVVLRAAIRTRRMAPALVAPGLSYKGTGMIGQVGEVRRALDPDGSVYVAGEEWSARSAAESAVPRGMPVRVVAQDGLVLVVEPIAPDLPAGASALPA